MSASGFRTGIVPPHRLVVRQVERFVEVSIPGVESVRESFESVRDTMCALCQTQTHLARGTLRRHGVHDGIEGRCCRQARRSLARFATRMLATSTERQLTAPSPRL